MKQLIIRINNFIIQKTSSRYVADQMLILVPHCLQLHSCTCDVIDSITKCERCGRCSIRTILELSEQYAIPTVVATGGRLAVSKVKMHKPKLVIAVACSNELMLGIFAVFPVRVYAVENATPNGPCKDTCVDTEKIRTVIEQFLRL